jgi:OOP family OmpA-OmpF porin
MKRFLMIGSLLLLGIYSFFGIVLADSQDYEGSKDPPQFNRMPGYYISDYEEKEFDSVEFKIKANKSAIIEGHCFRLEYSVKDDAKTASLVQVVRNYCNAVKNSGGQIVYSAPDEATLKVATKTAETWVYVGVYNGGNLYRLTIVEKQLMQQDIVADAASLAQSIKNKGKVEIYGIYFDTGKSNIKSDSEPALQQIAKLLQDSPQLKLLVVGHTDNVGGIDANLKLSKERADAVVKALIGKYSVSASRLQAFGVGPLAPVESNQTEEGRAKNRRVELVAQ